MCSRQVTSASENTEKIEHLSFLYDAYTPECARWELLECLKKLLLTGLPSLVFSDPVAQMAAAQLVSAGVCHPTVQAPVWQCIALAWRTF